MEREAPIKTPQDRYIQVGTINTRYWAEGNQGSTVLLIHGITQYVECWRPTFDVLSAHHRVYALDLPGHGRTDKPINVSYSMANLGRFVGDFMATLGIEHAHIIGHSLGGAAVIQLALQQPAIVDKLGLISSAGLGREVMPLLSLMAIPLLGEALSRPSRWAAKNLVNIMVADPAVMPDELVELFYQMSLLPGAQQVFLKILRENGNLFGQRADIYQSNIRRLPSIQKPALVVWGRQDRIIPMIHADVAIKHLPDVRAKIFDHCGHFPMLEHQQAFNELVLDFLSG